MLIEALGIFRKLQNTQNLKNNQDQTQISQDLTQNLKRQEFRNLPQTNQ
jgi:hypothetical protein